MGLQIRKLLQGSTTAVSLTLKDQGGIPIDWSSGTLSTLLTPTSGTAITVQGTNSAANSGVGIVTISAGNLTSMGILNLGVPTLVHAKSTFTTVGSVPYVEEFSMPVGPDDGEWVYGLTTLATAREFLSLCDNSQDGLLMKAIRSASQRIRRKCGRDLNNGFKSESRAEEYDNRLAGELPLIEAPITVITSVVVRTSTTDEDTQAASTYEISSDQKRLRFFGSLSTLWDAGRLFPNRFGRPSGRVGRFPLRQVRVTYTGGYTTVPPNLEQICLNLVAQEWAAKGQDRSMQSENFGKYSYTRRAPADVDSWLTDALADGGWISARALV